MFAVSMIAAQDCLDMEFAAATCKSLGGDDLTVLSYGEAVEFAVSALPAEFAALRQSLFDQGIDANILPMQGRRKKLLLADMDSTMIEQECIDELAAEAGMGAQVSAITARAMNGELDFNAALRERVGLLKGLPASVIQTVLENRISLARGGICLVHTMRANGAHCSLVSGGFTAFTQMVATRLQFHDHHANQLEIKDDHLTGNVIPPILGREAKVAALDAFCTQLNITPDQAIAVGDGANDLGMLGKAGIGVALHAKPAVAAQSKIRINHGDLTALLFLQGYRRDQFV